MPIQYYDPTWFNNRPTQARAKLAPKIIVAFVPGSTNFFASTGDNAPSEKQLTAKYGEQVFSQYDLNFGTAESGKASDADDEDKDGEGEGDSIGSQDSDGEEEIDISDVASMASFIDSDTEGSADDEEDYNGSGASDGAGEADGHASQHPMSDDDADRKAQFAAAYDIDMDQLDRDTYEGDGLEYIEGS
ncbi:hypothetical protein R3P38DRAFT_3213904 [Favolaschia claudopus]|uniref:Uncharacterized protein n=1 Tax=Favolaschia claudopus TaxID=2862362 RepID=A0AAW0ABG8_9AGAR